MIKNVLRRLICAALVLCMISSAAAANLLFDYNKDGKTDVSDVVKAEAGDKQAALEEALGGRDELHKNEDGHYEIWSSLGLYQMAAMADEGETFVLMQDIDMEGKLWTPVEDFNGKLLGELHTISNVKLTTDVSGNMGFFGSIAEGGSVEWLNLKDMNIIATEDTGAIGLVAGSCAGTVEACTAVGFVTDNRTKLKQDLMVGGLVGMLSSTGRVETNVENMLFANPDDEIPNISAKVGTYFAALTSDEHQRVLKIVASADGFVDAMALLQDVTGTLPDPNAIAWVTNDGTTTYPHSLAEMLDLVQSDGNTEITLQADIVNSAVISIPYSCTLDLNGHSMRREPSKGNCMEVDQAGSENPVMTLKNGTVYHQEMGLRVNYGAVVTQDVIFYGVNAPCVGIYDPSPAYNEIHRIEDCELYNATWGVFAYNRAESDFSNVNITIQRSKLVGYNKTNPSALFVKRSGSTGGTVTLGLDVEMYTYGSTINSGNTIMGYDPVKLADAATVDVDGVTYTGLNHWTTNEAVIATEVIAEVTNGNDMIQVTNTRDMTAAVSSTGNTQIKLLKDITCTTDLKLPYSCTVDLNGHTITNIGGTALRFAAVGSQNTVAKVMNGTVNHKTFGIRVDTGSIDLSNVTLNGTGSNSAVVFYDPNPIYRAGNKVDNCYIYNPKAQAITWNVKDTDFSGTGVQVTNSTFVCPSGYVFGKTTNATSGVVELGEHVDMYGSASMLAPSSYRYSGLRAGKTENVKVTAGGSELTLTKWSTDKQTETLNVLLIGNSLSTTIPEELYKIAQNAGYELTVTDLYHGGCRSWQHLEWYENESEEYEYRVYNDMGFWFQGDIKTSNEAFTYMDWDYVSFQDFFTVYYAGSVESALSYHEESTDKYIAILKETFPDAELFYYEHWAWQVGHSSIPDVAAQEALFGVIRDVSHYFADKHDLKLIPCGEAWELARDDALIGDTLCKDDFLHDNYATGGQYLNGCVFFEVLFRESCIGDTWRASNGPSEEKHIALQQHAHNAVAAVYGEDYAK